MLISLGPSKGSNSQMWLPLDNAAPDRRLTASTDFITAHVTSTVRMFPLYLLWQLSSRPLIWNNSCHFLYQLRGKIFALYVTLFVPLGLEYKCHGDKGLVHCVHSCILRAQTARNYCQHSNCRNSVCIWERLKCCWII